MRFAYCALRAQRLWPAGEHDGDRAPIFDHLASGSERPGVGVDAKRHDRVALLVGRIKEAAGRIETDEAGNAALCGLPAGRLQQSVACVGSKDGNAVVAAVRAVDEAAIR